MEEYTIVLSVILVLICLAILVWACANLAAKFTEFMHSLPLLIMILVFILFPPTLIVFIIGWFILSLKKKKAVEAYKSLMEESACPLVTHIIQEQFDHPASCKSVTIVSEASDGFYKAKAILDDGNAIQITIEEKENDQIYVQIPSNQ